MLFILTFISRWNYLLQGLKKKKISCSAEDWTLAFGCQGKHSSTELPSHLFQLYSSVFTMNGLLNPEPTCKSERRSLPLKVSGGCLSAAVSFSREWNHRIGQSGEGLANSLKYWESKGRARALAIARGWPAEWHRLLGRQAGYTFDLCSLS